MADESRKAVKDMLSQVRARLIDLEEAIDSCPGDLTGYDKRLDRIDDRIYLLEVEIEKRAAAIKAGEAVPPPNQTKTQAAATQAGNTAASVADKAMDAASKAASTAATAVTSFTSAFSSSLNEEQSAQPAPAQQGQGNAPSPEPEGTSDPEGDPNAASSDAPTSSTKTVENDATSKRNEQMRSTVRDLNVIYQEGRETLDDLSSAISDIREPFDKISNTIPRRGRRRW
ncbi:MAG: hypothetical protein ACOX1O_06475 [Eggerthellaceae bacterium]|jgi:predicted nuclease with TOPRIM domain